MELQPNMYVRYKYENCIYIGKIKFISEVMGFDETLAFAIDNCMEEILKKDIIGEPSFNIIDLIEVGDIITTNNLCGEVTHIEGDKIYTTCYDGEYCYDYQIQSILTCEQFESMKYEVE